MSRDAGEGFAHLSETVDNSWGAVLRTVFAGLRDASRNRPIAVLDLSVQLILPLRGTMPGIGESLPDTPDRPLRRQQQGSRPHVRSGKSAAFAAPGLDTGVFLPGVSGFARMPPIRRWCNDSE